MAMLFACLFSENPSRMHVPWKLRISFTIVKTDADSIRVPSQEQPERNLCQIWQKRNLCVMNTTDTTKICDDQTLCNLCTFTLAIISRWQRECQLKSVGIRRLQIWEACDHLSKKDKTKNSMSTLVSDMAWISIGAGSNQDRCYC